MKNKFSIVLGLAFGLGSLSLPASTIWSETFSYADGPLTNVSGGLWLPHSGTGNFPVTVASGAITGLSSGSASREDVNRLLDATYSSGVLYAGFDMSLASAPIAGSSYFFHFRDDGTGFRARVYIGAPIASGFRLGLENDASDGGATVLYSGDLDLNTSYRVVVAYDVGVRTSRLWIDGLDEGTPTLEDTAIATLVNISSVAFRQGASGSTNSLGYSGLTIDNLFVGTTFGDVAVPEPSTFALLGLGLLALVAARRRRG